MIDAEKRLAELRKLHDSIIRNTHMGLISIDKNRVVTSWNPAAERLLGYSAGEVVGHATPDLWHDRGDIIVGAKQLASEDSYPSDPLFAEALRRGEYIQECIFVRKDGFKIPVRLTITPILAEDRSLIGFLEHATDISELRRASHQVRELHKVLQDTMSGWAKLDLEDRYVEVNGAFAEAAGYVPEDMKGLTWHSTVVPDDLPSVLAAHKKMLVPGRGEARARGIRRDGSIFHIEAFLAPAQDHLGNRVGSYVFMRDVTARVEAEEKLEASEHRYREFFDLNPLPSCIYNPQTLCFSEVNEAAVRHYGYTREQFLSMSVNDFIIPEEAELIEREFTKDTKVSSSLSGPWRSRLADGTIIEVELAVRTLSETARLVVIRDVTEQRLAEALRISEATLREAQRIARLGSWELRSKSDSVICSPETLRIFELEAPSQELRYADFLNMVHPDDRDQVGSAIANSLQQKQGYDLQFRVLRRNGELRHIHGRGQYSNGSCERLTGTMLDITEQKHFQDALQQSLNEKEVLLREIHHRVKNNLYVISCFLNMQAETVQEETASAALRESDRRVMAMALIHESLYGHNRLDRINFSEYAQTLVQDLLGSYVQSGSEIAGKFSLAAIELDIEQAIPCGLILNELVTNALKYAYPHAGAGSIFVTFQQIADQKLSLSVADNGPGLPAEFDWNGSKSLGITIVKLLTKQLGGTLQIESSDTGATFRVIFPKHELKESLDSV